MPLKQNNSIARQLDEILELAPESVRPEIITFQATIGVATLVQPANAVIHPEYKFVIQGIRGYAQQAKPLDTDVSYAAVPAIDPRNLALISFQMLEPGRGWQFFNDSTGFTPNLGAFVGHQGSAKDFRFPIHYVMPPNGVLQVRFQRAAGWVIAQAANDMIVGLEVYGYLVRPST